MLTVILVRHGETDWNQERRVQGSGSDRQLTETGKQQAESIGSRLKQENIQAIYSSPLRRARDTAQAIARYHQLEVQIEPSLNEIYAGELEGVSLKKIGSFLSELVARERGYESIHRQYGGESLIEVQQRAWSAIQRLVDKHRDGAIVVVSHYFVTLSIICSVLNLPLSEMGRLRLDTGSISTILFDERGIRLTLFNDNCHLAAGK